LLLEINYCVLDQTVIGKEILFDGLDT